MSARTRVLIVLLMTVLGIVSLAREPVEKGRPLSQWIALMNASNPAIRQEACLAAANLRDRAAPAVPALARALRDPDTGVRYAAAYALFFVGGAARNALPELEAALKDPDAGVRSMVAMTLGDSNIAAARSVPALNDPDSSVRLYAQSALENIQKTKASPPAAGSISTPSGAAGKATQAPFSADANESPITLQYRCAPMIAKSLSKASISG